MDVSILVEENARLNDTVARNWGKLQRKLNLLKNTIDSGLVGNNAATEEMSQEIIRLNQELDAVKAALANSAQMASNQANDVQSILRQTSIHQDQFMKQMDEIEKEIKTKRTRSEDDEEAVVGEDRGGSYRRIEPYRVQDTFPTVPSGNLVLMEAQFGWQQTLQLLTKIYGAILAGKLYDEVGQHEQPWLSPTEFTMIGERAVKLIVSILGDMEKYGPLKAFVDTVEPKRPQSVLLSLATEEGQNEKQQISNEYEAVVKTMEASPIYNKLHKEMKDRLNAVQDKVTADRARPYIMQAWSALWVLLAAVRTVHKLRYLGAESLNYLAELLLDKVFGRLQQSSKEIIMSLPQERIHELQDSGLLNFSKEEGPLALSAGKYHYLLGFKPGKPMNIRPGETIRPLRVWEYVLAYEKAYNLRNRHRGDPVDPSMPQYVPFKLGTGQGEIVIPGGFSVRNMRKAARMGMPYKGEDPIERQRYMAVGNPQRYDKNLLQMLTAAIGANMEAEVRRYKATVDNLKSVQDGMEVARLDPHTKDLFS
jgi:hypothetical protein